MIVTDCSAIVDAFVAYDSHRVVELIVGQRLVAPALIDYEFMSAIRGLSLGGHLSEHRAHDAIDEFEQLSLERWGLHAELRRRVFDLRQTISAYDAAYVALAEALECPMLTRDHRLARAAGRMVEVIVV